MLRCGRQKPRECITGAGALQSQHVTHCEGNPAAIHTSTYQPHSKVCQQLAKLGARRVLLQSELGFPREALEPLDVAEPIPPMPAPALPPFNGYGTLDDSKQNCIALVPKPPKKVRRTVSHRLQTSKPCCTSQTRAIINIDYVIINHHTQLQHGIVLQGLQENVMQLSSMITSLG